MKPLLALLALALAGCANLPIPIRGQVSYTGRYGETISAGYDGKSIVVGLEGDFKTIRRPR
jgi:starvation-inducible outer membrane lipoprotein